MGKGRLEAFTDAIIPIIMTVIVLELEMPRELSWLGLWEIKQQLISYTISFFLLAIVWGNHHHMFQIVEKINGGVIWANTLLLFFLSFIPYTTKIVDIDPANHFSEQLYTLVFIGVNIAWNLLRISLIKADPDNTAIQETLVHDRKSWLTLIAFFVVFLLSFVWSQIGMLGTLLVMVMWIIPYKKIEIMLKGD